MNAERWEAVGHPVVKNLHSALCEQEEYILSNSTTRSGNVQQSHAQLLRAVELEDLLVRKINSWVGEKKTRDFINEPLVLAEYSKLAKHLQDAISSKDESNKAFWQKDIATPLPSKVIFDQFFTSSWMSLPQAAGASSPDARDDKKVKKHKKEKKSKKSKKSKKQDSPSSEGKSLSAPTDSRYHPYAGNNPIGNVTRALMQMD